MTKAALSRTALWAMTMASAPATCLSAPSVEIGGIAIPNAVRSTSVAERLEVFGRQFALDHVEIHASASDVARDILRSVGLGDRPVLVQASTALVELSWWQNGQLVQVRIRDRSARTGATRAEALLIRSAPAAAPRPADSGRDLLPWPARVGRKLADSVGDQRYRLAVGELPMPLESATRAMKTHLSNQGFFERERAGQRTADTVFVFFERSREGRAVLLKAHESGTQVVVQALERPQPQ